MNLPAQHATHGPSGPLGPRGPHRTARRRAAHRRTVRLAAVTVAGAVLLAGCATAATDTAAAPTTTMAPPTAVASLVDLDPAQFQQRLIEDPAALVINVHVPYEGEIEGTEEFIPFDQISGNPKLPTDRSTPLLLYCRSGRMSQQAGDALVAAGYTNVAQLAGGMQAWEADGRPLRTSNR